MSDWPAPDPGIAEAARLRTEGASCGLDAVIRAAWDAGLTVLPILPPVGDVEIRLVSDRDPLGQRFVGPLDQAVEDAFAFLCRREEWTCCVCNEQITDHAWIAHQRLGVRWHATHGVNVPICGENVSGHCLQWGDARVALEMPS